MPRRHQFAHFMRRPPFGGVCMKCADCYLRGIAAMENESEGFLSARHCGDGKNCSAAAWALLA
eukprot:11177433-Lingulodinium_polyedra.AAC.1